MNPRLQLRRNASTTFIRAALIAGSNPPTNPIISATPVAVTRIIGVM